MASWLQLYASLRRHVKVRRLARELEIGEDHAFGLICSLYTVALDYAPSSGDLEASALGGGRPEDLPDELAHEVRWMGDPEELVRAYRACRILDGWRVHDWEYANTGLYGLEMKREAGRKGGKASGKSRSSTDDGADEKSKTKQASKGASKQSPKGASKGGRTHSSIHSFNHSDARADAREAPPGPGSGQGPDPAGAPEPEAEPSSAVAIDFRERALRQMERAKEKSGSG